MITIADILMPQHVQLDVKTTNHSEAVQEIAALLKGDERIKDWEAFFSSLQGQNTCISVAPKSGICIPHARTDGVAKMIMSVGRSKRGTSISGSEARIHFLFMIGVPVALTSNYLRIVGALVRIFKEPANRKVLGSVEQPEDFLKRLVALEMKL